MIIPEVSNIELMKLYEAAIEFKQMKPWLWMSGAPLFAVRNPADGEMAYCTIMGDMGEVFGLAAYLGDEGLRGYDNVTRGMIEGGDPSAIHSQRCLMVSFEDREYLDKQDLKTIKELGIKFRGRKEWPFFRYFEPGYFPWFLNEYQVKFLTIILQQAIDVSHSFLKDSGYMELPEEKCLLRFSETINGMRIWREKIIELDIRDEEIIIPKYTNEIKLRGLRKAIKDRLGIWGVEWFFSPEPVGEGDKPYYPVVMIFVETQSHQIINFELTTKENHLVRLQEGLIETMERLHVFPESIVVQRQDVFEAFKGISDSLSIPMELDEDNELFKDLMNDMFNFFREK